MQSVQVSEYMNRHPVVFREKMPIEEAVELLLKPSSAVARLLTIIKK